MSTLLAEAHVFIHRHRCPLSARSRNPHVLLLLGVEDTRSAVSWLHLAASAAHRLNGLADCIDSRVGAASCGCRARCSCWLGRHFIDATWWFDFTLSSQASGSVGPGSHSERELVGWIVRVMAKVDCPQPQIAILTVRVSWIIQVLRNNNVPRPDCDRAFP